MAVDKLIPRLEFNEQVLTGTISNGSPTITSIVTTKLIAGMLITGANIPAGTTILSKTSNTVTMSANATGSATQSITFFERFDFSYPPRKDTDEQENTVETTSKALSGRVQVVVHYILVSRDLTFSFLTNTQKETIRDRFYRNWAALGNEFRYFPDKADSVYFTYQMKSRTLKNLRVVKKHPDFLYELSFSFERIVDV